MQLCNFSAAFISHLSGLHINLIFLGQDREDGSEISGNGVHFPLQVGGTPSQSSEEQSEQPMVSQCIGRLEAKIIEDIEKSEGKEIALGQ